MTDFLKANPYVTKEEYLWDWTIPQVKLSSFDFTHTIFLSEEEAKKSKAKRIDSAEDLVNDLGIPITSFKNNNQKV